MSYSFSVEATTKVEAKAAAAVKFDEVLKGQPTHAADLPFHRVALDAAIDTLHDESPHKSETPKIYASASGSVGWANHQDDPHFTSAQVQVAARWA